MIDYLIVYFQFFTVIPIPVEINQSGDKLKKAVPYFPLFASLYSLLLVGIFCLLRLFLTDWTAATLCLGMDILLTRGFHYDALADTVDGLWSSRSVESILKIMKDPLIGANGVLVLLLVLLIKSLLFFDLTLVEEFPAVTMIFVWASGGRCLIPWMFMDFTYVSANPHGLGAVFKGVSKQEIFLSQFIALMIYGLIDLQLVGVYLVATLFILIYRHSVIRKIGGMTGDTMGACVPLGQVVLLFLLIIFY